MWIWKKGSVNAAPSTTRFRRTQHLQPAAAFSSLLSGLQALLQVLGRRLISRHFFSAAAHKTIHHKQLPGTGFLSFASFAHGASFQMHRWHHSHVAVLCSELNVPFVLPAFVAKALAMRALATRVFPIHGFASVAQVQSCVSFLAHFLCRKCPLSRDYQGDHPWQLPRSRLQRKPNL